MPTERIAMRRVREILRLSGDAGLATREVARRTGVAPSTLREMFRRFERSGLAWPLPLALADADLEARLYGEAGTKQGHRRRAEPDWAALNRELKKKHVTLQILWDEYIEAHPGGYRYSRFCDLYRGWEARLPVTMRQTHLGGDKLFVDYAGDTVPVIVDPQTGRTRRAHIFVAVMGGSSLSFAHASWTETLPDWIDAHARTFAYRSVLYVRVPKLFDELALAHGDGSAGRRLKTLGAAQLLILDDWGLEPLGAQARHDLLEILEDRYGRRSTIVTRLASCRSPTGTPSSANRASHGATFLDRLVRNRRC